MNAPGVAIHVDNLRKSYGSVEVLKGLSFDVAVGETLCILGGSGGGKSTLMRVLIGAHPPTAGRVQVLGHPLGELTGQPLDDARKRFGVMFQAGALLNSLTVAQNVALPLEYHTRHDAETVETMVKIKLHQVDLLHAADRLPSELSGGMQKRAAVARALALDPRLLFYDEPSAGLDPIATARIDGLIRKLQTSMGITNVVITHVLESVERIADRVLFLDQGKAVFHGTLDDFKASDDPRIQQFLTGDLDGPGGEVTSTEDFHRDLLGQSPNAHE